MLCLFLVAHSSLFVPSKNENRSGWSGWNWFGCVPCKKTCRMEGKRGCFPSFHDKRFEKNCHKVYSLLTVLIMSFTIIYFSFRFYSTWRCRHIMRLHTLNYSESEIKFWRINWYNLEGYCLSWRGSSFNFFIAEIFKRMSYFHYVSSKL